MTALIPAHRGARLCLLLTVLLTAVAPWGIPRLQLDNGIERWVTSKDAAANFLAFQQDFGGEDFLLLAYTGGPLFDEDALDLQRKVAEAIEALPGVSSVQSLPTLFRDQFGAESGEELEAEVASSPFYDGAIIAADREMAGIIIGSMTAESAEARHEFIAAIRRAANPLLENGWQTYLVGPAALNATLDDASQSESRRLLPVAMAASCGLLLVLLRSAKKTVVVALVAALSLANTLGLMGWLDLSMNMVTVALPPVLWVLSTAYTVHVLRYFDRARACENAPADARENALAQAARPSLLAALTTALGFLALVTGEMVPVQELGFAAAMGIPVAFVVTFGVTPLLLPWLWNAHAIPETPEAHKESSFILTAPLRWSRRIVLGAALAAILCAALTTQVKQESNPLTFLRPDTPIVRDSRIVADRFTGLYTLETVLQLPGVWLDPVNWTAIDAHADALAQNPGVARVLSPLDHLRKLNQWASGGDPDAYRLPEDQQAAAALLDALSPSDQGPLRALVSDDGTRVRLASLIREMDGQRLLDIVHESDGALGNTPGVTGYHTGVVLRLVRAQFALIQTQVKSLLLAIVIVFAVMALGLRSRRLLLLAIAPNLAPVLALFGVMGLLGIPLDPATVMVAAMALGIAVDDTMHLLVTWRERNESGMDPGEALRAALNINGPAMTATTLTACVGFLTLALSTFTPIRYFGLLSAVAMVAALAADLWLLPALIHLTIRKKPAT